MAEPVVVVVEDEPQIRRFLRAALAGQGYRLFEADTGEDGLIQAGRPTPPARGISPRSRGWVIGC